MSVEVAIRKFKESDAEEFYAAVSESRDHLGEWLPWCTSAYSLQDAKEWCQSAPSVWQQGMDYRFVVEDSVSSEILGTVGINQIVPQHNIGNLGYWVRKSAINKGVCTRAARLAISYAFAELGLQRIEVHAHPENHASNSVALKLGGEYEGTFRNKLYFKGKPVHARCYSVIPSDYEA